MSTQNLLIKEKSVVGNDYYIKHPKISSDLTSTHQLCSSSTNQPQGSLAIIMKGATEVFLLLFPYHSILPHSIFS